MLIQKRESRDVLQASPECPFYVFRDPGITKILFFGTRRKKVNGKCKKKSFFNLMYNIFYCCAVLLLLYGFCKTSVVRPSGSSGSIWRLGPRPATGRGQLSEKLGSDQAERAFSICSNSQADFLVSYQVLSYEWAGAVVFVSAAGRLLSPTYIPARIHENTKSNNIRADPY